MRQPELIVFESATTFCSDLPDSNNNHSPMFQTPDVFSFNFIFMPKFVDFAVTGRNTSENIEKLYVKLLSSESF